MLSENKRIFVNYRPATTLRTFAARGRLECVQFSKVGLVPLRDDLFSHGKRSEKKKRSAALLEGGRLTSWGSVLRFNARVEVGSGRVYIGSFVTTEWSCGVV